MVTVDASTRSRARRRRSLRWRFRRRDRVAQPSTRDPFPRDDSYSERAARRRRFGSYRGASVRSRGGHRGRRGDAHLHRRSIGDDDDAPGSGTRARRRRDGRVVEHFRTFGDVRRRVRRCARRGVPVHPAHRGGAAELRGGVRDTSTVAAGTVDGALVAWRRRGGSPVRRGPRSRSGRATRGRWPVVDAEVTHRRGARCSTGRARATTTRHRWEMESAETVPRAGGGGRCEKNCRFWRFRRAARHLEDQRQPDGGSPSETDI